MTHPTLTEEQKLTIFIILLDEEAMKWATAVMGNSTDFQTYAQFVTLVFDHTPDGKEISEQLLAIRQGPRRVSEYAMEFHTLAAGTRLHYRQEGLIKHSSNTSSHLHTHI